MLTKNKNSGEIINATFHKHANLISNQINELIIFSHIGLFSQDFVNSIAVTLESIMIASGDRKPVIKRMFSILIEGLQNIRVHSSKMEDEFSLGFVIVSKSDHHYTVQFGNIVEKEEEEDLARNLNDLNIASQEKLKEMYHGILTNGLFSDKGGAGLGFFTLKIKSDHPIDFLFEEEDDNKLMFKYVLTINR